MIKKYICEFLQLHHIPLNAGFLIAVSGGADSITLLHAFKYLNLKILALHCNFSLRGDESNKDEQFVKRFCDRYGIPLSVKRFDTSDYAQKQKISIEMAARELRYQWFREVKTQKNMDYIVTGHQADDVAETLFINLCRGTGIKGITGIKPVNGDIIRPLLPFSREDILHYIEDHHLGFRTDSSNNSLEFTRNIIRHKIIPVCKEINPSFLHTISDNCLNFKETECLFEYAIRQLKKEVTEENEKETLFHIHKIKNSPAPATLLYELLHPYGFNKTQVRDILNSSETIAGKQFFSDTYTLTKDRIYWRLYNHDKIKPFHMWIDGEGCYQLNGQTFKFEFLPRKEIKEIPTDPWNIFLDADKLKFPLLVRNWEEGDRFFPLGMHRLSKKISDFFTDQKFSSHQKATCLLLLSEQKIACILGYRLDERFKIISSTQTILNIRRIQE